MEKRRGINKTKCVRIVLLILLDILLINLAQFLALFVRLEFSMEGLRESGFLKPVMDFAPYYTAMVVVGFSVTGVYNSLWQYVSVEEALRICGVVAVCGIAEYFCLSLLEWYVPKSFPFLNILFLAVLTVGSRFSYRVVRSLLHRGIDHDGQARTMLIGAGSAGAMVLRDLKSSEMSKNQVVCIIDDDPQKLGSWLNGVRIVGNRSDIKKAAEKYRISEIILAIPTCTGNERRKILELCQETGRITKILPGLAELAGENGTVCYGQQIRQVKIEDLLGRDSIRLDMHGISNHIRNKTVLVTGGGGSIGSELCRQIAARQPRQLIIFDIYENNAYDIQQELKHRYPELDLVVLIGSVRDKARMETVFRRYRPQLIYHAAAHKHVPLMEDSPNEAIKNNVFGTYNVAELAERYRAEAFLLISTDKAVNPTNIMGASKRLCEMIIQMFSRHSAHTRFVAVRFGNVLGSNGSVIPLFRRQIEQGGPVTVTHKDIIRYFMTIPEAVSLVLQAGVYAKGGEVFVLDMGDPVRIDDLARNMIRLSGLEPDKDIKIIYTGLRPGEKLFEELLLKEEGLEKTANDLIFVGHPNGFSDEELAQSLQELAVMCKANSPDICAAVARIVKTYHPMQASSREPVGVRS